MKSPTLYSRIMTVAFTAVLLMSCTSPEPKVTATVSTAPAPTTVEAPNVDVKVMEEVEAMASESPKAMPVVNKEVPKDEPSEDKTSKEKAPKPTSKAEKPAKKQKEAKSPQPEKPLIKETTDVVEEAPVEKVVVPEVVEKVETPKKTETKPVEEKPQEVVVAKPNHTAFDALLRKYVTSSGKVNYKGIKSNQAALEAYLKDLSANPPADSWSRKEKMAYWINAYNAFTIKLILDNYPVSSITKLHGGKPWDVKWIELGGKKYSLNNIENDILRPKYKDARIHFAVNCAAKSCPPLLNRAWTAANLNSNFEKQAKAFINNSKFNSISSSKVEISKIFEWYAVDFGDIKTYLNKYANTKAGAAASVSYREYDWALNE